MTRSARLLAVTLLSAATLAYEILLVRIFAIEHFHHFAYMAIGVAMLGFGASGTLLALAGKLDQRAAARWFFWSGVAAAVSLIASPTLVHQISLDPTQLAWDLGEWLQLSVVYALLALPFGVGALAILSALTLEPGRPGRIYGASFLGSGLGAALAVVILWFVFPSRALAVPAVLAALGAATASRSAAVGARARWLAWCVVVACILVVVRPPWQLKVSPYKGLPQVESYPDARRVAEHTSPLGWVVAVDAAAFRYAPGLSLAFRGELPEQTALFVDGQIAGATTAWAGDSAAAAVLDWLPTALPYAALKPERVLVIGSGGGTETWNALVHGARRVTAVELHPELVRHAKAAAPPEHRREGEIEWIVGDARNYVARSREEFDLVTLAPAGGFATSAAGVHSLNEDFLHTVEAYVGYLHRLSGDGMLGITRWLVVPPRESIRVILTAAEALRRVRPDALAGGLIVARSWGTVTVVVKPSGFTAAQVQALRDWATDRFFDIDWYPGLDAPSSTFNFLEEPTLFEAASAAVQGPESAARFAATYPFEVSPVDDARPYPHHFLRTGSLRALLETDRGSWLPFAEWGQIALIATLGQSIVLAGLLMVIPAAIHGRRRRGARWPALVGYFGAIGLAYLAAEIAAIQQLGLLLGHPVYAVAVVLAAFLICSGAGSAWSDRLGATRGWIPSASVAGMLVIYGALLLALVHLVQPAHLLLRGVVAVAALAPLAFLMGMPFPMGLRLLAGDDTVRIAWAWAANGFASVVAAPLAALIALEAGSPTLFVVAAAAYGAAAALGRFGLRAGPAPIRANT